MGQHIKLKINILCPKHNTAATMLRVCQRIMSSDERDAAQAISL